MRFSVHLKKQQRVQVFQSNIDNEHKSVANFLRTKSDVNLVVAVAEKADLH